jgi:alcohol dehydrogenase (NADP+)
MAAPMLCGGATVFTPLKQYGAGTTAQDVGIIGIGGLVRMHFLFYQNLI